FHGDTEGGDLVFEAVSLFGPSHPDADSIFAPLGADTEGSQGLYDPFFQCGDETPYVWAATSQIDHDICYALSRPVIGELASATAFVDGKTSVDNVGVVRAGAGGVERRVGAGADEGERARRGGSAGARSLA